MFLLASRLVDFIVLESKTSRCEAMVRARDLVELEAFSIVHQFFIQNMRAVPKHFRNKP